MINLLLVLALIVVLVMLLATSELGYTLRRMRAFRRRRSGRRLRRPRLGLLARFRREPELHVDLREIRDFVISLHLGTSMEETLSGALTETAEQMQGRSDFGDRLYKHVQTRLSIAPEEVIQGLIDDFHSEHLRDLLQRLEMARDGGISYDRALSLTISQLEEEIKGDVRRDIQRMPIELTLPMIAGVFLPAILIGLFPIVMTFLSQISLRFGPVR
jgi:hypothetical protein